MNTKEMIKVYRNYGFSYSGWFKSTIFILALVFLYLSLTEKDPLFIALSVVAWMFVGHRSGHYDGYFDGFTDK